MFLLYECNFLNKISFPFYRKENGHKSWKNHSNKSISVSCYLLLFLMILLTTIGIIFLIRQDLYKNVSNKDSSIANISNQETPLVVRRNISKNNDSQVPVLNMGSTLDQVPGGGGRQGGWRFQLATPLAMNSSGRPASARPAGPGPGGATAGARAIGCVYYVITSFASAEDVEDKPLARCSVRDAGAR